MRPEDFIIHRCVCKRLHIINIDLIKPLHDGFVFSILQVLTNCVGVPSETSFDPFTLRLVLINFSWLFSDPKGLSSCAVWRKWYRLCASTLPRRRRRYLAAYHVVSVIAAHSAHSVMFSSSSRSENAYCPRWWVLIACDQRLNFRR